MDEIQRTLIKAGRKDLAQKYYHKIHGASETYKLLRKEYPKAAGKIGEISKLLDWDIEGAMSFCLHLLEDVNAHSEMREVEKLFTKQMKSFASIKEFFI